MSAAKMVLMGMVGAGAGAFLALSTIPSFAPYRDGAASVPYSDDADGGRAYAQASAARRQGAPERGEPEQGLAVRLGADRGTLVLELPAWAGNTVEWLGFGRRVWDDWRQFSERFEEAPRGYLQEPSRPAWRQSQPGSAEPYGYTEYGDHHNQERHESGDGDEALTADVAQAAPEPDAADLAAQRAGEAVRDVLAAQGQ